MIKLQEFEKIYHSLHCIDQSLLGVWEHFKQAFASIEGKPCQQYYGFGRAAIKSSE